MPPSPVILIAPDSFKESLSAAEAAEAMARGARAARPDAEIICVPIADGGEGFVATLTDQGRGEVIRARVTGPVGEPVEAVWGRLGGGRVAVIEMAQAAGLERVAPAKRNPLDTTTFGVGELMRAAVGAGAESLIVGLGGSATNDGGLGLAQALGFEFRDARGQVIPSPAAGSDLPRVQRIVPPDDWTIARWHDCSRVACDVDNPLLGPHGAARTYAAQKGAAPEQIETLERGMANLADVIESDLGQDVRRMAGAGAAGGLGAGLVAFAGAELCPGAGVVLDAVGFDGHLARASLALTGEGAVNAQTVRGKAPAEVCRRAQARGIPTVILAGDISRAPVALRSGPLVTLRSIAPPGTSRSVSMRDAAALLEAAAREAVALSP